MSSTSRLLLRQYLSEDEYVGDWLSETTTGAGGASGINLICSALIGKGDDYYKNWYAVLPLGPGGVTSYEVRQVSAFTSTTGTVTVSGYRNFSAQVSTAVAFELHKYDPTKKHAALLASGRYLAGKGLFMDVVDVSLIVDNIAANPTFQTYASSAFTGWSNVGTPTIAEETSRILPGFSRSASIAATGAVEGLSQNLLTYANQNAIAGKTLNIRGWLWCATADSARLRVTFDGATYYSSDYVSGSEEWEGPAAITISQAIPTTLSEMTVSALLASGVTGYVQMVAAWIDRVYRYAVPTSLRYVDKIRQQVNEDNTDDWQLLSWGNRPISGRILRLEGRGTLSLPASDTATMQVGDWELPLLLKRAAGELNGVLANDVTGADRLERLERSREAKAEVERMLATGNHGGHIIGSNRGGGVWETHWESGTQYLHLKA